MKTITERFLFTYMIPVMCIFIVAPIPCCFYTVRFAHKDDCHWVRAEDIHKLTETEIEFTSLFTRQKVKGNNFSIIEPIIPAFRKEPNND